MSGSRPRASCNQYTVYAKRASNLLCTDAGDDGDANMICMQLSQLTANIRNLQVSIVSNGANRWAAQKPKYVVECAQSARQTTRLHQLQLA
eukprot:6207099-Pleurochrysis_carterae.AAC.2